MFFIGIPDPNMKCKIVSEFYFRDKYHSSSVYVKLPIEYHTAIILLSL